MVSTPIIHALLLIYRPKRDGRLSQRSWLTHGGHAVYLQSGHLSFGACGEKKMSISDRCSALPPPYHADAVVGLPISIGGVCHRLRMCE